ncbi:sterol desaturase family protein [Salipiger sp. H15]|uniref:Sterol desaturase family protein n=1 Tax=Alloyangia sp. H15 TaxID=3029062 RepID=A0AAU8AD52_9RHOB
MISFLIENVLPSLQSAARAILLPLPFFALLGVAVKRRTLFTDLRRALPETRTNLLIHVVDAILVAPILTAMALSVGALFREYDLTLVPPGAWDGLPPVLVGFVAVFLGDFIGYWRHRLEHLPLFWPSHAVHHSDTEMTWLAIFRFHPINRLSTTLVDFTFLLFFGLPPYALLVNSFVRHFYGAFIHADLPWTYGPLGRVVVSPAMHRWHHANDPAAYNTNYATVFSLFDGVFGTFRVPGRCDIPLGVSDRMEPGLVGQLVHPLRPGSYGFLRQRLRQRLSAFRKEAPDA